MCNDPCGLNGRRISTYYYIATAVHDVYLVVVVVVRVVSLFLCLPGGMRNDYGNVGLGLFECSKLFFFSVRSLIVSGFYLICLIFTSISEVSNRFFSFAKKTYFPASTSRCNK